jgi:UDP-glucose 4-epimerase
LTRRDIIYFGWKPDIIIHLAANVGGSRYIYGKKQYEILNNNIDIDQKIVSYAKMKNAHIIYFSTSCIYEMDSSYAVAKRLGEDLIKYSGLKYLILRPQNVYGPEDTRKGEKEGVINAFFRKALSNKKQIDIYGGTQKRSFIHVEDVCKIIDRNLKKIDNRVIDLGGEWISINNLIKKILKIVGKNKIINHIKIKGQNKKYIKFKKAGKSLDRGLIDVYKWKKSLL